MVKVQKTIKNCIKFLHKKPLLKFKLRGLKNNSGRSKCGKIVCRHKGGGQKQRYRIINSEKKLNFNGIVTSIEYDPNRTANIASIYNFNEDNHYLYKIAPKHLKIGDIIKIGANAEINLGHTLPIAKIPEGTYIYNVFAKFTKAAGTFSQLIEKNTYNCKIKLSSGNIKTFPLKCTATIGIVSNEHHFLVSLNKAGKSRWLNKRPTVRGVAMNPVDHPHGGGEGKKSGNRLTPWGKSC